MSLEDARSVQVVKYITRYVFENNADMSPTFWRSDGVRDQGLVGALVSSDIKELMERIHKPFATTVIVDGNNFETCFTTRTDC